MPRKDEFLTEIINKIEKATDSENLMSLLEGIKELDLINEPKDAEANDSEDEELKIRCFNLLADAYYKAAEKIRDDGDRFQDLSNFSNVYMDTSKFWQKQARDLRVKSLMQIGMQLQSQKNHHEAIKSFKDAIDLQPSEIEKCNILISLGKSYTYIKEFEKASKYFNDALEIDPNNSSALFGIGIVLLKSNKHQEAITYFQTAIKISPQNVNYYIELGHLYYYIKQWTEAKEWLVKASKIDGKSFHVWNTLGSVYNDGFSDNKNAEECFKKALDLNPDSLTARTNLSETTMIQGRYNESEGYLKPVIEVTDSHRHGLISRLLLVCSCFLQNKPAQYIGYALNDFINYYESMPDDYNINWYFDGLKRKIGSSDISAEYKDILVKLISLIEGGKNQSAFAAANDLVMKWINMNKSTLPAHSEITARNIEVYNTSERDSELEGWYAWEVYVGPNSILPMIDSVKYILHPTFQTNVKIINKREGGFKLKAAGWGEFRIKLEILLISKQVITKYHWLKLEGPTPLDTIYSNSG